MIPRTFSCVLILVLASAPGFGQKSAETATQPGTAAVAAAASAPAIPKDPKELMLLAARVNGLSTDMKAWHIKVNFQTFDVDGNPRDQGVFEEWRDGAQKWKVSYTSKGFNQVMFRNGDLNLRRQTGDAGWIPIQDRIGMSALYGFIPDKERIEKEAFFRPADRTIGSVSLHCLYPGVDPRLARSQDFRGSPVATFWTFAGFPTVCFNPDSAIARVEVMEDGYAALFDNVVQVDGYFVPRDIWVKNSGVPLAHLTVTTLELPAKIEDSVFVAPASATLVPAQRYNSGVKAGHRTAGRDPVYPPLAKAQKIEGRVILAAVITKDGKLADLTPIAGPKLLRQSALDAVKTWKYKPYTLNGQPVEVETTIKVIYTLGL
jgi:TonB family protein